jgi:hypothetical protein
MAYILVYFLDMGWGDVVRVSRGARSARSSSIFVILHQGVAVQNITVDPIEERIFLHPAGILSVPSRPHEHVEWGFGRGGRVAASQLRTSVDGRCC